MNPTLWLKGSTSNTVEVEGAERMLLLSGQRATAADGSPQHNGDIVSQFALSWSNPKDALANCRGPLRLV